MQGSWTVLLESLTHRPWALYAAHPQKACSLACKEQGCTHAEARADEATVQGHDLRAPAACMAGSSNESCRWEARGRSGGRDMRTAATLLGAPVSRSPGGLLLALFTSCLAMRGCSCSTSCGRAASSTLQERRMPPAGSPAAAASRAAASRASAPALPGTGLAYAASSSAPVQGASREASLSEDSRLGACPGGGSGSACGWSGVIGVAPRRAAVEPLPAAPGRPLADRDGPSAGPGAAGSARRAGGTGERVASGMARRRSTTSTAEGRLRGFVAKQLHGGRRTISQGLSRARADSRQTQPIRG